MSAITPGERRELRTVVKQQFKVLCTEIKQREVELDAESEQRVLTRYRRSDELVEEARRLLQRKAADLLREMQEYVDEVNAREGTHLEVVQDYRGWHIASSDNRTQERRTLQATLKEQVQTAALNLDRQEADLLRSIATDALETDEARAWVTAIPTVAELVPSRRLREIEAQFDGEVTT